MKSSNAFVFCYSCIYTVCMIHFHQNSFPTYCGCCVLKVTHEGENSELGLQI